MLAATCPGVGALFVCWLKAEGGSEKPKINVHAVVVVVVVVTAAIAETDFSFSFSLRTAGLCCGGQFSNMRCCADPFEASC
jgi:hypothetical protein